MNDKQAWSLLAKGLSGALTAKEAAELDTLMKDNPEWRRMYHQLQNLRATVRQDALIKAEEMADMESRGLKKMEDWLSYETGRPRRQGTSLGRPYRKWVGWCTAAALISVVVGFAWLWWSQRRLQAPLVADAPIQNGLSAVETYVAAKMTAIELMDGTRVWLNSGSKLRCSPGFDKANREVYLTGEGFFDVAQDASHPFVVHLKKAVKIKVLGTRFNVKAYPNTPYIETALLSGKIALDLDETSDNDLVLQPHEKVTINLKTVEPEPQADGKQQGVVLAPLKLNPVDHKISETAWMENRLSFYDMSFEQLALELERKYGKQIVFTSARLKQYHLTGSFKNESLAEVLEALQITTPFHYQEKDQQVVLSLKP